MASNETYHPKTEHGIMTNTAVVNLGKFTKFIYSVCRDEKILLPPNLMCILVMIIKSQNMTKGYIFMPPTIL
jgi:hypothetical protein